MILFVAPLPPPTTGHSLACQRVLEALERRGSSVTVVNLAKRSFRQGISSWSRIVEVVGSLRRIARYRRSARAIYLTNVESLFGNLKDLLIFGLCWNQLPRMVIHLHGGTGMREIMSGRRGRWLALVNRFFARRFGGVIVLGPRLRDIYASCVPPERLHTAENFADDALFVEEQRVRGKFARRGPLRLLFLSNLLPGKGHVELVAALRLVAAQERALLQVDIAGGFEDERQKDAFLRDIADLPEVTYHGVAAGEQKRLLLERAHVFCLPTYYAYEGQPISILEAYASGCAVMTTDHSGIFDVFTPGLNGVAVSPRSPRSIADAIAEGLRAPAQLLEYGIANTKLARERFTVERSTARIMAVIDAVAAREDAI